MDSEIADKVKTLLNFGFYIQNIMDEKYRYLDTIVENVYEDWNFGFQLGVGFMFELTEKIGLGVNYNWQSDFTDFKTKENQILSDKQKLTNLNTIGLLVKYQL